jgi:hypothetical protein
MDTITTQGKVLPPDFPVTEPGQNPEIGQTRKTTNIVFTGLFGLTELYWHIARRLPRETMTINWITTNEYWTRYLRQKGVTESNVLELIYTPDDFLDPEQEKIIEREIIEGEDQYDLSVNRMILMDRFLKDKPRADIKRYIFRYYHDIKRFLQDRNITHVFAEPTNLNDILTCLVCRRLDIAYVSPRDMRYPPKRLMFFEGIKQNRIYLRPDTDGCTAGGDLINTFANRKPTPFYFERINRMRVIYPIKIIKAALRRLKRIGLVSGRSLVHYDVWGRIKLTAKRALNSFYMKRLCRYTKLEEIKGRTAFYGLHVQPENSIDVLGPFVSDQLNLIKNILRSLPFDTTLIIKEHPNFLGMKSIGFFRELRKLPNVALVRHDVSTFDIYKRVSLVLTVSGTTAYEAGMLGIPAVTFAPMYFGNLSTIRYCEDIADLQETITRLLKSPERNYEADCEFLGALHRNSYDAYWTDPIFDRAVLDPDNIEKLAAAFTTFLNHDYR